MTLPPSHRHIIMLLDQFRQLSSEHIRQLVFADAASRTSSDRALKRLREDGFIDSLRRRSVGGVRGGSGQTVHVLGRAGWKLAGRTDRYYKPVSPDYHALTIADIAVRLRQAERAGELVVREMVTEPECWLTVQGIELRPDLAVVLERPGTGAQLSAYIEADLATERASRITEKLTRYMEAYKRATASDLDEYRRIYFVSEKEPRRAEIAYLIGKLPEDKSRYLRSVLLESFPQSL